MNLPLEFGLDQHLDQAAFQLLNVYSGSDRFSKLFTCKSNDVLSQSSCSFRANQRARQFENQPQGQVQC